MTKHTQCVLKKDNRVQTAWIDSKLAKIGNFVMLKEDGAWEQGWEILEANTIMESDKITDMRDAYRHHRKNTDI